MKLSNGNWRNAAVFSVLLLGLTLAGCSQRESLPGVGENAASDQQLPFEARSDKAGNFPTGVLAPTAIPAGTAVTIHLRLSLSSASSRSGDPFEAELDQPIMVRGRTVVPRGALLAGKVLEARAADRFQEPGYLRLALTAISINGKFLPMQSSIIFMKRGSHEQRNVTILRDGSGKKGALIGASIDAPGTTYAAGSMDVGVAPERPLTFRLAQPLPL
ncbi:MAG: hypothetical protein ACRD23_13925 [Terriglobales bacterium]